MPINMGFLSDAPTLRDRAACTWLSWRWGHGDSLSRAELGRARGPPCQLLLEGVLDFLAALLEVALGLIGVALGLEGLITGGLFAGALLDLPLAPPVCIGRVWPLRG
jgi:hypothetical protein